MVLSKTINYLMYLEKENKDEAALVQELAGQFGSSSE
jgi:hypothetical protein